MILEESMCTLKKIKWQRILRALKKFNVPISNIRNLNLQIEYKDLMTIGSSLQMYAISSSDTEDIERKKKKIYNMNCFYNMFFFKHKNYILFENPIYS